MVVYGDIKCFIVDCWEKVDCVVEFGIDEIIDFQIFYFFDCFCVEFDCCDLYICVFVFVYIFV